MNRASHAFPRWAVVLLLAWSGCLPHSCQRTESRALFPADSLSRAIAAETPADTLTRRWRAVDPGGTGFEYPRSVQWSPDGNRLYVSDAGSGTITVLTRDGSFVSRVGNLEVEHPYLVGWKADALAVLDPDAGRLLYVRDGGVRRTVDIDAPEALDRAFVYAVQRSDGAVVKTVRKDRGAQLLYLNESGVVAKTQPLEGPYWRHAGFLRAWGDSLISLCGYRPVVDVVSGGTVDSLALLGFDSPMLSRSRLFVLGDVDEPPLLYASAAPAGDRLFVLNMRPGWLRVDVFDRDGRLRRVLSEPSELDYGYYPVDLAVHQTPGGDYDVAVAVAGNAPRVDVYRWSPTDSP